MYDICKDDETKYIGLYVMKLNDEYFISSFPIGKFYFKIKFGNQRKII